MPPCREVYFPACRTSSARPAGCSTPTRPVPARVVRHLLRGTAVHRLAGTAVDHARRASPRPPEPHRARGSRAHRHRHRALVRHRPAGAAPPHRRGRLHLGLHQPGGRRGGRRGAPARRRPRDGHLPSALLFAPWSSGAERWAASRSTCTRPISAWVMRDDPAIRYWGGDALEVEPGLTLIHCGGHFAGSTVLHWAEGADGLGALLTRRHDHGGPGPPHRQLHVQLPQPDPAQRARRAAQSSPPSSRSSSSRSTAAGSERTCCESRQSGGPLLRSALPPRHRRTVTESGGRKGGSALAVDLRRARAAAGRPSSAAAGAAAGAEAAPRQARRGGLRGPRADRLRARVVRAARLGAVPVPGRGLARLPRRVRAA